MFMKMTPLTRLSLILVHLVMNLRPSLQLETQLRGRQYYMI